MQATAGPKRLRNRPGQPGTAQAIPDDFGLELSFKQLGQCLGMSRYKAKILVVDNNIPTIQRGRLHKVPRRIAWQLVDGDWWLQSNNA